MSEKVWPLSQILELIVISAQILFSRNNKAIGISCSFHADVFFFEMFFNILIYFILSLTASDLILLKGLVREHFHLQFLILSYFGYEAFLLIVSYKVRQLRTCGVCSLSFAWGNPEI